MTSAASTASAFLVLPLEIRRNVYQFCIPQNGNFNLTGNIYNGHRDEGWSEPPWRWDRSPNSHHLSGTYYSSEIRDCPDCEGQAASASALHMLRDGDEQDEPGEHELLGQSGYEDDYENECGTSWSSDNEDEYVLGSDYCGACKRYRPEVPSSRRSALPGLLLVCRQITEEVETMLYGGNTFTTELPGMGKYGVGQFSPRTREKMRKMVLRLLPMGTESDPGSRMTPEVWDSALASLSKLWIMAGFYMVYNPLRQSEDDFEKWRAWLSPILEYLSRALPREASIVADVNEEEDMVQMLEKVLPGRCHFQQLEVADFMFARGRFSGIGDRIDPDY